MGFLGVYTALYDYQPQGQGELEIREGDLLYLLEKNAEDDWWKVKKKADPEDEDEPEGLVPNNYVEQVCLCRSPVFFFPMSISIARDVVRSDLTRRTGPANSPCQSALRLHSTDRRRSVVYRRRRLGRLRCI